MFKNALYASCLLAVASSLPLMADSILSMGAVNGNLYQQTEQSPCIFSNPSCQNGAFPTTDLPTGGNETGYNSLSVNYLGSQILNLLNGDALNLGIDINQASGQPAQTLTSLIMRVYSDQAHTTLLSTDTFTGSTGNVAAGNNGNGYADYLISGFSTFTANQYVQFHFVFNDANDGTENVFIIGSEGTPPSDVPEPVSMLLTGTGLVGVYFIGRRRRR